jgi:uncharacterized membrane protein YhaH (DUF805 family)
MNEHPGALLHPGRRLGRRAFWIVGLFLFLLKFFIDWQVATQLFGRAWTPFSYLKPTDVIGGITALDPADRAFYLTMAAVALPFIWIGVTMTLNRLRDAGLPLWLVVCFFLPMPVNLLFFAVIDDGDRDRGAPRACLAACRLLQPPAAARRLDLPDRHRLPSLRRD